MISVDRFDPFIDPSITPVILRPFLLVVSDSFFRVVMCSQQRSSRDVLTTMVVFFQTLHRSNHRSHPALVQDDVGERGPLELIRGLISGQ
jgi:hypothetical protein